MDAMQRETNILVVKSEDVDGGAARAASRGVACEVVCDIVTEGGGPVDVRVSDECT